MYNLLEIQFIKSELMLEYVKLARDGNKKIEDKIILFYFDKIMNSMSRKYSSKEIDDQNLSLFIVAAIKCAINNYDLGSRCPFYSYLSSCVNRAVARRPNKKKYDFADMYYFTDIINNFDFEKRGELVIDVCDMYEQGEFITIIKNSLALLGEREQEIIKLRYLDNRKIAEIAKIFMISNQRVFQIIQKSLTKIRIYLLENEKSKSYLNDDEKNALKIKLDY